MVSSGPRPFLYFLLIAVAAFIAFSGQTRDLLGYQDTPILPGTPWHVHDGRRPQPPYAALPANFSESVPAPDGAMVLFDGTSLDRFQTEAGQPANWRLESGTMVVQGTDSLVSRETFGDCHLHVEWAAPARLQGAGQARGNSGIYLFGRYEIQVLDSFRNPTYPDGQAGAIYGQFPPRVNVCRPPGEWQSFDIEFRAPRFVRRVLERPATVTAWQNGVLIHDHQAILGETVFGQLPHYVPCGTSGPIKLQNHLSPVRFRNIWIQHLRESAR